MIDHFYVIKVGNTHGTTGYQVPLDFFILPCLSGFTCYNKNISKELKNYF